MSPIDEYIAVIDRIFGVFLDSTYGFHLGVKEIQRQQDEKLKDAKGNLDKARYELDSKFLNYSIENPSRIDHEILVREYKEKNWPGGHNDQWAARMALVTIYSFWEHRYRGEIATFLNKEANSLKVNELGDLRYYRHAILHNLGRGYEGFDKLKVFDWFVSGDEILLDMQKMKTITDSLKTAIRKLGSA